METAWSYTFENEHAAHLIQVKTFDDLAKSLPEIGLHEARPTLVLVGGASGVSEADMTRLQQLFIEAIAPIAQELNVMVVDGATDAGIMRLIGHARTQVGATFPLIGVAAIGTVRLPDTPDLGNDTALLEPNHTHFILVPGSNWGDESPWLSRVASVLSPGLPSATLVINGGEITLQDVSHSVQADRPVITLEGSGRTADKLAAAVRGEATDVRAEQLAASDLLQTIDLTKQPDQVALVMKRMLSKILHIEPTELLS